MGGQTSSQQSNQTSTVQLPPWVNAASQQNYGFAQGVANRPLVQYAGQQVADVAPATQQAWNLAQTSGNAGQPQYQAAEAGNLGVMASGTPTVTPGMLASTDLSPYMNPYTKDVVNTGMQALEAQRVQGIMGNGDKAAAAGAFGGSRQGITDAVTNSQSALAAGQLSSQLNAQNFAQAQGAATTDIGNQLDAAKSNQAATLTRNNQNLAGAGQMTALGQAAQGSALQQYSMLSNAGQQQQGQAQNNINANMNQFNQAWNYPTQQLNTLLSSLGMSPYGQTQTTQGATETSTTPDFASTALGLLSVGAGMFKSDKKSKKDISKIGEFPDSNLPAYSFRYKGAPASSPKVVGPMAQDVEKKFPGAVANISGTKYIKAGKIPGGPIARITKPKAHRTGGPKSVVASGPGQFGGVGILGAPKRAKGLMNG